MNNKLNKEDYTFAKRENEKLVKNPGQINGQSFLLRNLKNCQVYLCDFISALYIQNCENCEIYTGPVSTSVFMRQSNLTKLTTAAAQIRISDSSNINAFLFSLTDLTLENSTGLVLAPFNLAYSGLSEQFQKANLDVNNPNKAFRVYDFTPKPGNWSIMDIKDFSGNFIFELDQNISSLADNPVPFPFYFGGTSNFDIFAKNEDEDIDNDMMTFDITTGNDKAQKIVNEKLSDIKNVDNIIKENTYNEVNPSPNHMKEKNKIPVIFKENKTNNNFSHNELIEKKKNIEKEKMNKLLTKENKEKELKQKKREDGKKWVEEFIKKRKTEIEKKRISNLENVNSNLENIKKSNPWEIITDNICFKANLNEKNEKKVFKSVLKNLREENLKKKEN